MRAELFLATTLLFGPPTAEELARRISIGRDVLFPANIFLVTAEARTPKVWMIQHVYIGPAEIKGQSIAGEFRRQPTPNDVGSSAFPKGFWRVSLGEGIFWITKDDLGKLKFCTDADDHLRFRFNNSRIKGGDDYYPLLLGPAEALETVYRASDQNRLARIDSVLKSGDIAKAQAVMWQLSKNSKDPKITDYLVELGRDRTLRVSVQIEVHHAIWARVKDWLGSAEQLQMVDRWLTEPWKDSHRPWNDPKKPTITGSDEANLFQWLRGMARRRDAMSHAHLLDFAVKGLANPQRSNEFRVRLLDEYKNTFATLWSRDELKEGFAYLVNAVKSRPKAAEKAAAAKLLAIFAPYAEDQRKQLRALLTVAADESVARELKIRLGD
jgi:hypothetical protein